VIAPHSDLTRIPSPAQTQSTKKQGRFAYQFSLNVGKYFSNHPQKLKPAWVRFKTLLPGIVAAGLSLGIWQIGAWQPLEQLGYNLQFQMRELDQNASAGWDKKIAIIAIDNKSLSQYGQFPWPRHRYAQLLQTLKPAKPAVIGFDLLFVDPSDYDEQFSQAIDQVGNVVLSQAWDEKGNALEPVPLLKKSAVNMGQIWHKPDSDGISRSAAIFIKNIPSLSLAMLNVYEKQIAALSLNPCLPTTTCEAQFKPLDLPQPIPQKKRQTIWLNWPGSAESLTTYSFADVIEGQVSPEAFTNKFVLIGVTATGLDPLRSPYNQSPPIAGVYLHAAILDNLLKSRQLKPLDEPIILTLIVILGIGTGLLWQKLGIKGRLLLILVLPITWLAVALLTLTYTHQWVPIAAPIGTMFFAGFSVQLRDYCQQVREQREKQLLMDLFAKYVSPETANLIWQRKSEIFQGNHIQSQTQIATVLFMDIRNFTAIAEKMKPEQLFTWLNDYLEVMSECIIEHGGVIDKYIGDAIMAVFGIPFVRNTQAEIQQDALNAVKAAIAMQAKLKQLNKRLFFQGKPLIKIGIGIHTGLVMAGSLGGSRRLNYSVVGDTVNVAARLESMNKKITVHNPYNLLVSKATYHYVNDYYEAKSIGATKLKGREKKLSVYLIHNQK
jgi:adenylate cyclase